MIESECDRIHIKSEPFERSSGDFHLNIAGVEYVDHAGINTVIDASSFQAVFSSGRNASLNQYLLHWSCYFHSQSGREGELWLGRYGNNEEIEWDINSDCLNIHLVSKYFDTEEGYDILRIDGRGYSGSGSIDQIINGSAFVATFISDRSETRTGFNVLWSCLTP